MSSSSRLLRVAAALLVLAAPLALAGCETFRPVYGENGITSEAIDISYARPANRLEQIVYQDLALRLGKSNADGVPRLALDVSSGSRELTGGTVTSPNSQRQMQVSAQITLTDAAGTVIYTGARAATADYVTTPQVLANKAAETEASERAARALAQTIRLLILGVLATPVQ